MSVSSISAQIALSLAKGVRAAEALRLIELTGSVEQFFSLPTDALRSLTGADSPVFDMNHRAELLKSGTAEANIVSDKGITAHFIGSDSYPHRLAECADAPAMLYSFGSCSLNQRHAVGIVGTRHATAYGIDFTSRLVKELAESVDDLLIVSGLAYGIDVAAHKAALECGVPTVGVMAHGLSRVYPAEHRQVAARMVQAAGAVVTEYTYATSPQPRYFLARNHIIAGLCDCVIVVESDIRGGAMSTARAARNYDREVLALPGRITDRYSLGTNKLIAESYAALISSAEDVISHMGWETRSQSKTEIPQLFRPLSAQEQLVIDFIRLHPEATVNEICVDLSLSFSAVADITFQLELDDIISSLPGGRFEVKTLI